MKEKLKVKTIGEPSIKDLPQDEAHVFYLTLLARVNEICPQKRKIKDSPLNSKGEE